MQEPHNSTNKLNCTTTVPVIQFHIILVSEHNAVAIYRVYCKMGITSKPHKIHNIGNNIDTN